MKWLPFFWVCLFVYTETAGQSPFNYGQNREVYFISSAERKKLALNNIMEINRQEGLTWFRTWSFAPGEIAATTLVSEDSNYVKADTVNLPATAEDGGDYYYYVLERGALSEYGGSGMGVHYWHRLRRYEKTSLLETTLVGGGSLPYLAYSRNVFGKDGRLMYSVAYPDIKDTLAEMFLTDDTISLKWFDYHMKQVIGSNDYIPDTIRYTYNSSGCLTGVGTKKIDASRPRSFFADSSWSSKDLYAGNKSLETHIKRKLGYLPRLILVEIYQYGVMSFYLDAGNKYRVGKPLILEGGSGVD